MGTGGALSLLPEIPKFPLLVMNGDLIMQTNIGSMFKFHEKNGFFATMGIRPYTVEIPFGCAEIIEDQLVGLVEKPTIEKSVNAGIYILSPNSIQTVRKSSFYPITSLFEEGLRKGKICGAYEIDDDWMDIGHPAGLRSASGLD